MKIQNNSFLALVEKAMREQGRSHMRPVIEKEILHYDILFALDNAGLLDRLTFQGGTSLRLCYGAQRFSEDLDFAGGYDFETQHLISMKACLEDYFVKHYGLEVSVKEPKELTHEPENRNINVSKWQISLVTHPERKDIPKQKIKIEVANIPAYTREPKQLQRNYNFLPDGYNNIIMMTESLDEILADKIVAFVNCQAYVRHRDIRDSHWLKQHRDIWDFHWLKQQGATVKMELVKKKIHDYKIEHYDKKLDETRKRLPEIIRGNEFKAQMSRFLPMSVQEKTLLNEMFLHWLLQETGTMLDELGFEYRMEENGDIYSTNSLRDLNSSVFEHTDIMTDSVKDKNGFVLTYRKKSRQLIVSSSDEGKAKELCEIYRDFLPNGYKVDPTLKQGEWFIKYA